MNDDFLKKLQDSLQSGEKNDEIVDHLNEINEKANKMNFNEAAENLDNRIAEAGAKEKVTEMELKEAEEEYAQVVAEQQKNDEQLAFLAHIESRNAEVKRLKEEYSKAIEKIQKEKITLMIEYEKKYGTKATDDFDFGPEQDTELEDNDSNQPL